MPNESEVRKAVRDRYAQLARTSDAQTSCCSPGSSETEAVPLEARQVYAGCGSPVESAELREGEVVVDLGSGGGFDVFKVAKLVGKDGRVIGVDATPEMVWRARETAKKYQIPNVEFRLAEIEHVPLESCSVDVVLSNCVINLAPDKGAVFREAYRILKPGGRLVVSDTVAESNVRIDREDLDAWAECVAGALPKDEYVALLGEAGFIDVQTKGDVPMRFGSEREESCCSPGISSVILTAVKPG